MEKYEHDIITVSFHADFNRCTINVYVFENLYSYL